MEAAYICMYGSGELLGSKASPQRPAAAGGISPATFFRGRGHIIESILRLARYNRRNHAFISRYLSFDSADARLYFPVLKLHLISRPTDRC